MLKCSVGDHQQASTTFCTTQGRHIHVAERYISDFECSCGRGCPAECAVTHVWQCWLRSAVLNDGLATPIGIQVTPMMPCTRALVIREAAGVCIPRRLQSPANRLLPVSAPQPSPRGRAERVSIHAERSSFSSDQSQTALQYQLERSAPQQAQPDTTQNQPDLKSYEQDLKHRQQSAREWVTPWLVSACLHESLWSISAHLQLWRCN